MQPLKTSRRVGVAPAWSVVALERTRRGRVPSRWHRLERVTAATIVPLSIGLGCGLLASLSMWSWLTAFVVACVAAACIALVRRSAIGRRWRANTEHDRRDWTACELRGERMARMTPAQRIELQSLEELVEHLRAQPIALASAHELANAGFIERLDGLVGLYVELAVDLEQTIAAFSTTADDLPGYVEPGTTFELSPRSSTYARITELRVQAREECRRRISRLRADLRGIGQVLRLVHEQALAAGLSRDEVARQLAEILDEAELAREARREVDGVALQIPARNGFAAPNENAMLAS